MAASEVDGGSVYPFLGSVNPSLGIYFEEESPLGNWIMLLGGPRTGRGGSASVKLAGAREFQSGMVLRQDKLVDGRPEMMGEIGEGIRTRPVLGLHYPLHG
jgi:hypothetical protein